MILQNQPEIAAAANPEVSGLAQVPQATTAAAPLAETIKISHFELASLAHAANGGGREIYNRTTLVSLLVVVQSEIERMAVLSGVCANVANALAVGVEGAKGRDLIQFFPADSTPLTLAGMRLAKWHADMATTSFLEDFHRSLDAAKQETIAFAATGYRHFSLDDTGRASVLSAWNKVMAGARALLMSLDQDLRSLGIDGVAFESQQLAALLADIERGGFPLIDRNGRAVLPAWAEQRNTPRIAIRAAGELERGGARQKITVRDMSITGVGVEGAEGLVVGDKVIVHLARAGALRGEVVWINANRAGVELDRPLHADDPAMAFLAVQENGAP